MKIQWLDQDLLCTYCWLLHTDIWHAIFHLISFSTISSMLTSVSNSNSTSVFLLLFFIHACHANPESDKKKKEDQAHMLLCIYCWSFQIHQPIVLHHSVWTYRSWYFPRFLILKSFQTFLCVFNQHLWYLLLSDCCQILSCLAMTFHWIFANYACTHIKMPLHNIIQNLLKSPPNDLLNPKPILCSTFFHNFCGTLTISMYCVVFDCNILEIRFTIFYTCFCGVHQKHNQPGLIVS